MNDLISRQAAIQALDNAAENWNIAEPYHEGIRTGFRNSARLIMSLPSVQLIQCKECIYGDKMKDTIRCELMEYLPVECDHFCSWAERIDNRVR